MRAALRFAALGAALTLAGCGQKGPLVLPDKNAQVTTSPASTARSEAAPAQSPPAPASAPAPPPPTAPPKPDDPSEDSQTPKSRL
jgi:predicted small lipoprotein YifL